MPPRPSRRRARTNVVHLQRRPFAHHFSIERVFAGVRARLPDHLDVEVVVSPYPSKGLLARLRGALHARQHQGDVTHVTGGDSYLGLLLDPARTVLTVHDTEFLDRAGRVKRLLYTWLWVRLPVRRAAVVTAPSERTRSDVLRITGCAEDKVRVIPNFVAGSFAPDPRPFDVERPTVLIVGTRPNKNVERAVAALAGLPCRVVLVGPLEESHTRALARAGLDYTVVVDLDEDAMVGCYRACDLLLFVSTNEGFGIPILEAQATGRPVVTSTVSPMPEVAGAGAALVDPFEVESIRAGVRRVLGDPDYRDALVEAGLRNVAAYRLEAVAARYAAVYDELLGARAPGPGENA